jgi:hypothetical protein
MSLLKLSLSDRRYVSKTTFLLHRRAINIAMIVLFADIFSNQQCDCFGAKVKTISCIAYRLLLVAPRDSCLRFMTDDICLEMSALETALLPHAEDSDWVICLRRHNFPRYHVQWYFTQHVYQLINFTMQNLPWKILNKFRVPLNPKTYTILTKPRVMPFPVT